MKMKESRICAEFLILFSFFGSILVLKFGIFIIFADIGQGSISQNIDKIEPVRT